MGDFSDVRQRNVANGGDGDGRVEAQGERVKLKRNVSLLHGISFIVGSIIGSGIFISPVGVLSESGSVGLSLVIWAASGILSLFGALSYAELGTMIPKSGGEYIYLLEALHPIVAYLFVWTRAIVIQPSGVAIICMTFASYAATFAEYCGTPAPPEKVITIAVILTLTIINAYSTAWASHVQLFFTVCKLGAIGIIIVGGFIKMGNDGASELDNAFEGTTKSPSGIALAFYDAMWAYDGWNTLNYLTEELKNPTRNMPIANVFGVLLIVVVYLLTNISYLVVLTPAGLLDSSAVAVDWGKEMLGSAYIILPIAVLFSTFGAANGFMFSSGRLFYAAGRENHMPEVLSFVHVKNYTPLPSLILTCVISIAMVIPSDIGALVNFFSFASWLFYSVAALCVIVLRFTRPDVERPIKVFILIPIIFMLWALFLVIAPIVEDPAIEILYAVIFMFGGLIFYFPFVVFKVFILIPIIFMLWALFLVIAPIVEDPAIEILYAVIFMFGGLIFYFPFVVFKLDRGCFDKVTMFIQLLCEVAPTKYEPET